MIYVSGKVFRAHIVNSTFKPWPHQASASASALMQASKLENGDDTDAWCGLNRYKSMWAITSVKADTDADTRCGQGLLVSDIYLRLTLSYFSTIIYSLHLIVKPLPNCQLVNVIMLNSDYHSLGLIFNKAERLIRCV